MLVVIGVWAVPGMLAAICAPRTPELLNIRGGSNRATEASHAADTLDARLSRPVSEFFAITPTAPAPLDSGPPRRLLDTLTAALRRQSYVGTVVSWASTGHSAFISADHRSTFLIVSLDVTTGDSAARVASSRRVDS